MHDEEAIRLIPTLRPIATATGMQFFGNPADAADVASETLLRLWAARSHIPAKSNLRGLTLRVARNVCISLYRSRHHDVSLPPDELQSIKGNAVSQQVSAIADAATPQTLLEENENQLWLAQRLSALPPSLARILRMKQEELLSTETIASIIGTDTHSVQTMLSRARRLLLTDLQRRNRNDNH